MKLNNKFNLGDHVYLTTDPDQLRRIVIAIQVSLNGLLYLLACGDSSCWHYEIEISNERDVLITTSN